MGLPNFCLTQLGVTIRHGLDWGIFYWGQRLAGPREPAFAWFWHRLGTVEGLFTSKWPGPSCLNNNHYLFWLNRNNSLDGLEASNVINNALSKRNIAFRHTYKKDKSCQLPVFWLSISYGFLAGHSVSKKKNCLSEDKRKCLLQTKPRQKERVAKSKSTQIT